MRPLLLAVLLCLVARTASAGLQEPSVPRSSDGDRFSWWTQNLRWTLDLSGRYAHNPRLGDGQSVFALGLDLHNVLSGDDGDVGTLTLQGYLTRLDDVGMRPVFFESEDDWEFVYRIFNFNYTRPFRERLNVRIGHYELPFGLEHLVNTNGTLRQYLHGPNLGVKADWGATLNGEIEGLEYEFGWSRGTGNEWTDRGGPGLFVGRLGTDRYEANIFGLSAMKGKVLTPGGIVERERYGVDATTILGPFNLMGELSFGEDFDQNVINGLGELNWRNPQESVLGYLQVRDLEREVGSSWQDNVSSSLGLRYTPDANWALSAQWTQAITTVADAHRDASFAVQLRYRL